MPMLAALRHKFFATHCMYSLPARFDSSPPPAPLTGVMVEWLSPDSIVTLFSGEAARRAAFTRFIQSGSAGVCLQLDGEWAAYAFMSLPGTARPPHIPQSLLRDTYWIYFCATKPKFGGKGLYKYAQRLLIHTALTRDATKQVLIDTTPDNTASRKAILSVGFAEAGMLRCNYLWLPKLASVPLAHTYQQHEPHPGFATAGSRL